MTNFDLYLFGATAVGFFVYLINFILYKKSHRWTIDPIVTIVPLLGGSLGILIGILIFDPKPAKDDMMSRVFLACVLVVQIIIVLIVKGVITENITLNFLAFFRSHKWLIWYLVAINVLAIILFGVDKINAIENRSRIRIVTLLGVAFIGGSFGSLLAMYLFRHKTKQDYFTTGIPLIMGMQAILLFYLMNV